MAITCRCSGGRVEMAPASSWRRSSSSRLSAGSPRPVRAASPRYVVESACRYSGRCLARAIARRSAMRHSQAPKGPSPRYVGRTGRRGGRPPGRRPQPRAGRRGYGGRARGRRAIHARRARGRPPGPRRERRPRARRSGDDAPIAVTVPDRRCETAERDGTSSAPPTRARRRAGERSARPSNVHEASGSPDAG